MSSDLTHEARRIRLARTFIRGASPPGIWPSKLVTWLDNLASGDIGHLSPLAKHVGLAGRLLGVGLARMDNLILAMTPSPPPAKPMAMTASRLQFSS